MRISQPIQKLLLAYKEEPKRQADSDEQKINVQMTISRLAYVYERIRNAIEYKDEHLLRKNAIERMLKRRIYNEGRKKDFGRLLLSELIRARYLKNNQLPESITGEIDAIIAKYLSLLKSVAPNRLTKERQKTSNWLLSVLSTEIDHHLVSHKREEALVECMYRVLRQDIDLSKDITDPKESNYQIFIGIHRALIKSDPAIVRYHILKFILPGWFKGEQESLDSFAQHFATYKKYIDNQVDHPLSGRILRYVKRYSILFNVLGDVMEKYGRNFESLLDDPEDLEEQIRIACNKRYKRAKIKLRRSYVRAIIYIFITKMLLALLLELPYDMFVIHTTNYTPLIINAIFHPVLMFIIAVSITMPSKKNTDRIVEQFMKVVRREPKSGFLGKERKSFGRSAFMTGLFRAIYAITFLLSYGLLIWAMTLLNFNIVSGMIFIFFFTVISFFGVKLRGEVRDLIIVGKRTNIFTFTIDFFTVPVIHMGRWISDKSPKINLFLFVLDSIIEAPLKVVIEALEDWGAYQREKKEDLY
ncbi:hypothetical protein ACFL04_01770 [Patescibacteria group bacterium]